MIAVEMPLYRICGVSLADRIDRIHNEKTQRMASTSEDVTVRMKNNVLRSFGHIEQMSDERMKIRCMMEKWMVREVEEDLSGPAKKKIKDTEGRWRKKHEDPHEGIYEEVDDRGRGKIGM